MKSSVTLFKHKNIITILFVRWKLSAFVFLRVLILFTMCKTTKTKLIFFPKWNKRKAFYYTEEPFVTLTRAFVSSKNSKKSAASVTVLFTLILTFQIEMLLPL